MSGDEPIELLAYDAERGVIRARREGEPSFVWVQSLADAFQAAGVRAVWMLWRAGGCEKNS